MAETTRGLDIPPIENNWGFKGKNYLFTIGIDKYTYWPPLKCAVKDVEDFIKIVTDRYQFEKENVIHLKDEEASVKNIMSGFRQLVGKITEDDNLVIYYSGHGHYDELTETGYWIPVDAHMGEENEHEFINTAIIVDRLKRINSLHTFLIIDSCFSGTLITQIRATPRSERYKSRRVFTSGGQEVVSDGSEGGNSPFSRGILYHLEKNTDKYIRASKLVLDVTEYVEKETQQTPKDARLINADDQGGDFVFYLKISEAELWADIVDQNTKEGYQKFIEQFPQSEHLEEAQETFDWLTVKENPAVYSLKAYLNKYLPDGKYVPEALRYLKDIEEEQLWEKAKNQNSLSAYFEYRYRYPEGKYAEEAERKIQEMGGDEGDEKLKKETEEKIKRDLTPIELPDEEKAWETAKNSDSYIAYLNFIQAYPESRFADEAQQEMKRLDNIALNQILLTEQNRSLSLQEKIEQCLNYFNSFPGAANNKIVKQIKDRLQIQKYSLGRGA